MNRKRNGSMAGVIGLMLGLLTFGVAEAASARVCESYARDYARHSSRQGQVLGSGVVGSLMGLGIGSIFGGGGLGAAIGGGVGMISGGARRQDTFNRMYQAAYQDCMAGRAR